MDLESDYNNLLETATNERIFDLLDSRREARQQQENCNE